jgi:hypothetical protein
MSGNVSGSSGRAEIGRVLSTRSSIQWLNPISCVVSAGLLGTALFVPAADISAQISSATAPIQQSQSAILAGLRVNGVDSKSTALGRRIRVDIQGLSAAVGSGSISPEKFMLYLDGYPVWNSQASMVAPWKGQLEFHLERADTSQSTWVALLGRPMSLSRKNVRVGVGYGAGPELLPSNVESPPKVNLVIVDWRWIVAAIFIIAALILFVLFAQRSDMIRDSFPPDPPPNKRKPFSLGRLQMAIWFFLVIVAFVFLYIVTGSVDVLNQTALMLIGIGTGTALSSAAIDKTKETTRREKLAALKPQGAQLAAEIKDLEHVVSASSGTQGRVTQDVPSPEGVLAQKRAELETVSVDLERLKSSEHSPISEGLLEDVLSDPNGISFHRFQMLLWTFVLGGVFLYEVWVTLAMPEFSGTLLALMGISAGTFIGFKFPESSG